MKMFVEPLEDRYNDVLKQRLSLEGDLAALRKRYDDDTLKLRKRKNLYLMLLLIVPFLTWYLTRPAPPSVDVNKILAQRDSLKNLLTIVEKTRVRQVRYPVRKNDNPALLAQLFFNDEKAAHQIIKDNNLDARGLNRELKVGDTLVIDFR